MACRIAVSSLVLFALALAATANKNFLGFKRKFDPASINAELQGVLAEVLGQGHGVEQARLNRIRSDLGPLFRSLPKNKQGRLSAPVMRYTVRRYFSQQHAWIVKGFEPHAELVSFSDAESDIVQGKVPDYIRSVLEARFAHNGFGSEDTVAMIATMERLMFDEVVASVELAFYLNSKAFIEKMNRAELMEVMSSYLITEMLEGTDDRAQHKVDKEHILERYPNWDTTFLFLVDVVSSDIFSRQHSVNPFTDKEIFSFEDVVRLGELISEQFGPWSNHECHEMRDMLVARDPHHTGRVRMADFYQETAEGAWQFLEPSQFLRQNGALDESSSYLGPQVIIANYINGMSNCITSAPYYSICCLNDCDQVFGHLENRIRSDTASAEDILSIVEGMPQGPTITTELRNRLEEVAQHHETRQIPIHGRLLAQWLHFVFPHECPYPHTSGTALAPKTQEQWRAQVGDEAESVTEEEVLQHLEAETSKRAPSPDAGKTMWVLEESVLDSATPSDKVDSLLGRLPIYFAQIAMVSSFATLAIKQLQRGIHQQGKSIEHDV